MKLFELSPSSDALGAIVLPLSVVSGQNSQVDIGVLKKLHPLGIGGGGW